MLKHGINLHSLVGERKHRSLKARLRNVCGDFKKEAHVARGVLALYLCDLSKSETFAECFPCDVQSNARPDSQLKSMLVQSIPFCTDLKICRALKTHIGEICCKDLIEVSGGDAQVPMLGEVVGTFAADTCMGTLEPYLLLHEWVPTGAEETWGTTGKHICIHAASVLATFVAVDVGGGCHRIRRPHFLQGV